ncbi:MAG: OmpH family outer membrane protein [Bacteroidetes bacterium]|nr:OmpH family outer membrane protein [Bacteroidota bacterium]MDA0889319.1 OmpH family outer membrane protein [Bacteroidota bacterium]MDA1085263.1 OmpH family outer membrane protein [Bacteroidota bacterium]
MTSLRASLFLLLISFTLVVKAQRNVRIGFLNIDNVLEAHKGYTTSSQELEEKITTWRNEIETKQKELDQQRESLELERPLLTEEIYEERAEDIRFEQDKLDQYIEKRFGTEGDWIKQKVLLAQPAQDEILTAIKEIADDRNLDYVFDSTAEILVLHSEKKYDISELVIRYLEIEDKKKAQEFLNETKKEERRQRTNPALEAKREALEKRKAERQKLLEERKAERERKKNNKKSGGKAANTVADDRPDEDQRAARKAEIEKKQKDRAAELAQRKKEQAEALAKRKKERLEELERRKKEIEEKRKQAQQKK